ncbi:unnamed protein product [Callosobruchus maculatus]|uniref:FHA domain-containing protein n=1 Tax=Callosobruchus maculatus TaxID=64391 RepID=A0A653CPU6_CALMS|nr:unnamed protein product [Callosobruchus maculatus]
MSKADESSDSDSSNDGAFGCLIFIRKKDGFSVPYDLVPGQITIGSADDADVRIKIPDKRLQDLHCLIEIDENGIATLVNKAGDDTVKVNNISVKKFKILQHNDTIDVIGKKIQYANENLLNDKVQPEKPVPASLSSRNRETINIFAQKRSPSKSPTFKVKSPSQRRHSTKRSPPKISDLIVLDTPDRSLGKKSPNRSSVHVTPKQVIYRPIVEDVSPATPPNSKETDDVFKTPVNTPALFEDIRKSVLQSRTRKSNKQILSADIEKEVINNKRGRESSVGSQRSVKRRRMMYSTDNNSEVEVLEESFESFDSEDWSEISQDQTDRAPRFSDLTRTSFAYPISKCMSEPKVRQVRSVRLSRHNKTISVNFDGCCDPPVTSSSLLANGIREDHLVESPRPSTSNLVMTRGSGSPLKNAIMNKSPLIRSPASAKLKRLQDSPKNNLGSPKLRSDSYISNNLSKFVGLKQLMRNRNDLSEVLGVNNVTSTPKICKSPKNDHTDVGGVMKVMARNSPKNTLLDISGVDVLFNSPIVQADDTIQVLQGEKSMCNTSIMNRSPKSLLRADDMPSPNESASTLKSSRISLSTTKTPTGIRRSRSSSKMSQALENEVLDLSAVKTPYPGVLHTSASRRSTKTPIAAATPDDAKKTGKSLSGSYVNVSLHTSNSKRVSRTPKKFDPSEYDLINVSKKSQIGESDEVDALDTSGPKRLTRSSQYDLVGTDGMKKSIPSPRPNQSRQNSVLEMNRSTVDHDYAKSFSHESTTSQLADSTDGINLETGAKRRSARSPVIKQRSDEMVYGSEVKKSLPISPTVNSSGLIDLDDGELRESVDDDEVQYIGESRESVSTSPDLNSPEVEVSSTGRLTRSLRTPRANKSADEDVFVSGSRKSRSLSQTNNSSVIDLDASKRSMRSLSAYQYPDGQISEIDLSKSRTSRKSLRTSENQNPDDDIVEIDISQTSEPRMSLRRSTNNHDAIDETVETDALETSESRKLQNASRNNQYHDNDDDMRMGSSRSSIRTPKSISCIDEDLMHTSGARTRTPNVVYKKSSSTPKMPDTSALDTSVASMSRRSIRTPGSTDDPDDDLIDGNGSRTSMSTYRRLTKTPGSSRKSGTTSQMLLDLYDVGETSAFRRLTREADENYTETNSQLFAYPMSDSLASSTSTRVSSSDSRRESKTPMASFSSWLSSSDFNVQETSASRRASRITGGKTYLNEQNISRSSISGSKLRDSVAVDSLNDSTSKSVTETSSGNIHPEDQLTNVSYSRVSTRLTKTPSAEKSLSTSQALDASKSSALESPLSRMSNRASSRNQCIGDDSRVFVSPRKSNSTTKLSNSSALHTLDSSVSKRSLTSTVDEHLEGGEMNESDSRHSTSKSVTEASCGNIHPEDQELNVSYSRASTRLTKTPSGEKSLSTSQTLDSRMSKIESSGNQCDGASSRDSIDPRKSNSTPKSLNSSTLNTRASRMSKRSLSSTVDEYFKGDVINVADSRNSISSTTKSPGSSKKSVSQSRIDSPAGTSEVGTDVTLEVGDLENSEPKRVTRTPQSVEHNDIMNVSSRSRRQTRTPSGNIYLEDEVMSISMTRKTASRITADSIANECIMGPRDAESFFAFHISNSPENDLSNVSGVKRLMKTPRTVKSPKNDLTHVVGVKKLLATPKAAKSPKNDLSDIRGVKTLLKTPRAPKSPKNDLTDIQGVKNLLKTPRVPKSPKNDLTDIQGVKKLLQTPKAPKSPKNDLSDIRGVKKLLKTPVAPKSPKNDLTNVGGLKKLMGTPKVQNSPRNDLTNVGGVKKLMSTPKQPKSPKNDLSAIVPFKRLMSTPKPTKEPCNDLSNVSGVKDLFSDNQEDLFASVFNKKPLRTYSGKLSTFRTEEQSLTEDDSVVFDSHKNELVEEWVKQQDLMVDMETHEEVDAQKSMKSDSKKQDKTREGSKTNKVEDVSETPVSLERESARKGQEREKEPKMRTRGKKNNTQEANIGDDNGETTEANKKSVQSVKPASRSRGKKRNEIEENETAVEEKPTKTTRGKKKIVEESTSDETDVVETNSTRSEKTESKKPVDAEETDTEISIVNVKPTRRGRSKKDQSVETVKDSEEKQITDTEVSAISEKPTRKGRSRKGLTVEAEKQQSMTEADEESNKKKEIATEQVKLVQTTEVQPRRGRNKVVDTVQEDTEVKVTPVRRGRNKKAVEAIQDESEAVTESPTVGRRGRNKKAADNDDLKDMKEPVAPIKKGQAKKKVQFAEDDSKKADSPAPSRKGRSRKAADADKDDGEEVKQAPGPVKRGRNKKASEADGDDVEEVKEAPAPIRRGRNKKASEADEDDVEEVKEAPAPVRRGRNKKASEVDVEEVKEAPAPARRGRNKKASKADEGDFKEENELPAPTRKGRNKKVNENEEVPKEIDESPAPAKRGTKKKASVVYGDCLTELKELPVPTKKGRNKKTAEADEDESSKDVKEPPIMGRNKRTVADVKEDEDVKESPVTKRLRGKAAVEVVAEEEQKRTRRARGGYDKYGGEFLSESPLNTKRIRSRK